MSTNFYYTVKGGEQKHIGKASNFGGQHGIHTFQGENVHSLEELKTVLLGEGVEIRDEYDQVVDTTKWVEDYIDGYMGFFGLYQLGFLHGSRTPVDSGYDPASGNSYWIDTNSGALFHRGEFS